MGKIILLALLAAAALTSCKQVGDDEITYDTVEIEGCEYIQVSRDLNTNIGVYALTHKGNCTNHGTTEIITNEENQ